MDDKHGEDLARNTSVFTPALDDTSTVIIGAGIIGCATAYYLSLNPDVRADTIHLVEASPELFASASGKAAGFCAPDWFGPATASLGALSFRLHQELAAEHDGPRNWGYSRSTGTSLVEGSGSGGDSLRDDGANRAEMAARHEYAGDEVGPAWLTMRKGDKVELLSEDGGVAQVDPLRLCHFLLRQSIARGVRLHQPATPIRLQRDLDNNLSGLRVRNTTHNVDFKLPCTRLVIAAGAWSTRVFETLFPASTLDIGVSHLAGHSLVLKSPRWTSEHAEEGAPPGCHAVFATTRDGFSPEIFSRSGGEIYMAGLNDPDLALPEVATDAKINPADISTLKGVAQRLLGQQGVEVGKEELETLREGLCFRPVTQRGVPVVARLEEEEGGVLGGLRTKGGTEGGVFVAAGHGPWGVSLGLGTGLVVGQMLEGAEEGADVSGLGL